MVASRDAGGRWASRRSAASRAAKPAGSQRTSAWSAGWAGSPTTTARPPGRTRPTALVQRRSASSSVRRSARASSQPGVEQHHRGVAALGDRLGAGRRHHDRRACAGTVGEHRVADGGAHRRRRGTRGRAPRRCARRPAPGARSPRWPHSRAGPAGRGRCRTSGRPAARSAPAGPSGPGAGAAPGRRTAALAGQRRRRSRAAGSAPAPARLEAASHEASCDLRRDPRRRAACGSRAVASLAPATATVTRCAARSRGATSSWAQPVRSR